MDSTTTAPTTETTTGKVEAVDEVKAGNGGKALRVTLEGEQHRFYDWGRHVDEAEVSIGDTIRIEHDGSRYPRISAIEQVAAYEPEFGDADRKKPLTIHDKDRLIVRMSCMKTAVELLGQSKLTFDAKERQVGTLAKDLEEWVCRQ